MVEYRIPKHWWWNLVVQKKFFPLEKSKRHIYSLIHLGDADSFVFGLMNYC